MLLMTLVISAIFFELSEIPLMVLTTSSTSEPPRLAVVEATSASWLA